MSDQITLWIHKLKSGDEQAAAQVWEQFFRRVRALAVKKLAATSQRAYDADDLALSAINALCVGARDDKFHQLENGKDLWQILAMITARKAANVWKKQSRSAEVGESIFGTGEDGAQGLQQIAGNPESESAFLESLDGTCSEMLSGLDERVREVALLRLQGYSHEEISGKIGRSVKSVERYMRLIREQWEKQTTAA